MDTTAWEGTECWGALGDGRAPRRPSVPRAAAREMGASLTPEGVSLVLAALWGVARGGLRLTWANLEASSGLCECFSFKVKRQEGVRGGARGLRFPDAY